ncbi:MAG: carboxypeptidase-like regulatory domain-containing protein, partial [Acidobacteriaceae bacterium]
MRLPWVANAIVLALLGAVCGSCCVAQSDTGGSVSGRVLGPDGRGVPGALVRIESAASGDHSDESSNAQGQFRFAAVLPGEYRLRVHAGGLSEWEADHLIVDLGSATRLNATLAPLSVHRTILVDARLSSAGPAVGMDAADLAALPNNSQHWADFVALFSASTPGSDGSLSFGGLSPLMNTIAVDGANNNLAFRGRERGTGAAGGANGFATGQSSVGE